MPPTLSGHLHHQETVMGTVVSFDIVIGGSCDEEQARIALQRACASLHHDDEMYSLWKPESPASRFRRGEVALDLCPIELQEVVASSSRMKVLTAGWFDAQALPGGFDPTGLVKGLAAQNALAMLLSGGISSAMVNAGGDICVAGCPSQGANWRIGIQHPQRRDQLLTVVEVEAAVATSGTYERGSHLYDPLRRRFSAAFESATVVGEDLGVADALATAAAVAGPAGLAVIEEIAGYEVMGVDRSGVVRMSSGFSRLIPQAIRRVFVSPDPHLSAPPSPRTRQLPSASTRRVSTAGSRRSS